MSLGSSWVVEFTRVYAGGRWNRLQSLDSLGSLGSLFCALVVFGFIQGLWVHSCALWGSLGSSMVIGFTGVRRGGCCVHLGWLGSLVYALGVVGSSWVAGFTRVRPGCRRFHPGSLSSLWCAQRVFGLIRGR